MIIKFIIACILLSFLPVETRLMVEAGHHANVRSVTTGTLNPVFVEACEEHVKLMAQHNQQGHPGWYNRYLYLRRRFPKLRIVEIASQSWPNQTLQEAAKDAFTISWPASPGHWRVANMSCIFYGASMKQGRNGITYCSMIVGY